MPRRGLRGECLPLLVGQLDLREIEFGHLEHRLHRAL
jgi:hypothetical protein